VGLNAIESSADFDEICSLDVRGNLGGGFHDTCSEAFVICAAILRSRLLEAIVCDLREVCEATQLGATFEGSWKRSEG
jgi:hypothetical protein